MANISHSNRNSQHSFIIGQRVLQLSVCFSSLYPLSFSLPNLPFRRGEIIVLASQHFICFFFFLHVTEEIKNRNLCNSIAILSFLVEQKSLVLICDILSHPDLDSSRRLSSPIKVNGFTLILITITWSQNTRWELHVLWSWGLPAAKLHRNASKHSVQ